MKNILDALLELDVENEIVEFKQAKTQYNKDKLGQYFSALSNEANLKGKSQAWLIFGVDDNKKVVGTSITERQLNEYKTEIVQHTSPRSCFKDIHKILKDGTTVLLFEIPAASKGMPIAWKGFRYGRDGESLGPVRNY